MENVSGQRAAAKVRNQVFKARSVKYLRPVLIGSLLPIFLLIAWELSSRLGIVPSYQLPAPSTIVQTIWKMLEDGSLFQHVGITMYRVFLGFLLGSLVAIIMGAFVGLYNIAEKVFDPLIQAFRSIPSLAWVPLFILWMGIGESSKITMIAVGVFFPVYLNIVSGITNVDQKLIEVGKMYRLNQFQLIFRVIFPASLPSILVGLRSGLGLGWMFVVAAELMGASEGLGFLLVFGQNTLSPELIMASILLFALIGKLSDWALKTIEQRLSHAQQQQ